MLRAFTLLLAAVLSLTPLPDVLNAYRPDFLATTILAWSVNRNHLRLELAWLIGLFTDILTSGLLGAYAAGFLVIAYLGQKISRQFVLLSLVHQLVLVTVILVLYFALLALLAGVSGQTPDLNKQALSLSASVLLWIPLWSLIYRESHY